MSASHKKSLVLAGFCCATLVVGWAWLLVGFATSSVTTGELHKPRGMFVDEHAISDGMSVASIKKDLRNDSSGPFSCLLQTFHKDALLSSISRYRRGRRAAEGAPHYHTLLHIGPIEQQKTRELSLLIVPISVDTIERHIVAFINDVACMLEQRGSSRNIALLVVDAKMRCDPDKLISAIYGTHKEIRGPLITDWGGLGLLREAVVVDLTGEGAVACDAHVRNQDRWSSALHSKNHYDYRTDFDDSWSAVHLAVDPVGPNGAVPNMDSIAAFRNVYKNSFLISSLESTDLMDNGFMAPQSPHSLYRASSIESLVHRTRSLLSFAASMLAPAPSLHGPLLARNVDAFTIRGIHAKQDNNGVKLSSRDIADLITKYLWSLQSLHEEMHHSFSLYLLMGSEYFVSFNEYCTWMLVAGAPLVAIGLWLASLPSSSGGLFKRRKGAKFVFYTFLGLDLFFPLLVIIVLSSLSSDLRLGFWIALNIAQWLLSAVWTQRSTGCSYSSDNQFVFERILLLRVVTLILINVFLIVFNAGAALLCLVVSPACVVLAAWPCLLGSNNELDGYKGFMISPPLRSIMGIMTSPLCIFIVSCSLLCGGPSISSPSLSALGGRAILVADRKLGDALAQVCDFDAL